ncbi:hypothetical protein OU678_22915, partial [Escherichia coli]|nr:hypothetical protein [Escherichia coli]
LILDGYSESSYSATPRFAAARLPWFCREHQLNTNLVYQKVKDRADSADEEFWGQIIETCKRKN